MNKGQNVDAPQVPIFEDGVGEDASGKNPPNAGAGGGGSVGSNTEGYRSEAYSFDSTALERAAKAAKVNIFNLNIAKKCPEFFLIYSPKSYFYLNNWPI